MCPCVFVCLVIPKIIFLAFFGMHSFSAAFKAAADLQ